MKTVSVVLVVALLAVVGGLVYMIVDGAISLDHSRAQNKRLREKCELLAKLTELGLRGRLAEETVRAMGPDVLIQREGSQLRVDGVVLSVEGGKITAVNVTETCGE